MALVPDERVCAALVHMLPAGMVGFHRRAPTTERTQAMMDASAAASPYYSRRLPRS